MKTIWVFGDSFSIDFENNFENYRKIKGFSPKSWGKLVSEEFGYEYKNYAVGGCDNHSILQSFCENVTEINPNDIVFIGWAPDVRLRLMDEDGSWTFFTGHIHNKEWCGLSSEVISKIMLNRVTSPHYNGKQGILDEILSWENMIKYTMKNNLLHIWRWNYDGLFTNYQTINEETNGLINDGHWSEKGHIDYSKDLIEKLRLN
jgi:hypothetical protein